MADALRTETLGVVSTFLNDGEGGFALGVELSSTGPFPQQVVAGDMDGDGDADLAVLSFRGLSNSRGAVAVFLNNGSGEFALNEEYPVGNGGQQMIQADFDGDGDPDLAVANTGSDVGSMAGKVVSVLLNMGDGTFEGPVDFRVKDDPSALAAGDLNGDGAVDLVAVDNDHALLWVLLNQQGERFGPDCNGNGVPDECEPDSDGNGVIDACEITPQQLCGPGLFGFLGFALLGTTALRRRPRRQ